jgi:hypothetical protein
VVPLLEVGSKLYGVKRTSPIPFLDTRSLGVFIIRIQYAEDLSAQDRNGKSDPYIVLAYAKVRHIAIHLAEAEAVFCSSESRSTALVSSLAISTLSLKRPHSYWLLTKK